MKLKLPNIGLRLVKSTCGVLLSFVIYYLRGKQGTPFYTCIALLQCLRTDRQEDKQMAIQRLTGTVIGSLYGLVIVLLFNNYQEWLRYLIISLTIIPIMHTTVAFHKKNAAYFACVVFLSITVNHILDANPFIFVYNRAMDTVIGIVLALCLNHFRLPYRKNEETLFVSTMDQTLLTLKNTITPYSRYNLNRMLDDGMSFTIASMRTPATLIENLRGLKINLPIITMDGAALYDMKNNHYIKKYELPYQDAKNFVDYIEKQGFHVFKNVILEDSWMIYYGDFVCDVEHTIYSQLKKSPYRNYIKDNLPIDKNVIYLMIVDRSERITVLYQQLQKEFDLSQYKIITYPSTDYPGYSYIKIYHHDATKQNMIKVLQKLCQLDKVVTFGSLAGQYDYVVDESNQVVKVLQKLYEPFQLPSIRRIYENIFK